MPYFIESKAYLIRTHILISEMLKHEKICHGTKEIWYLEMVRLRVYESKHQIILMFSVRKENILSADNEMTSGYDEQEVFRKAIAEHDKEKVGKNTFPLKLLFPLILRYYLPLGHASYEYGLVSNFAFSLSHTLPITKFH